MIQRRSHYVQVRDGVRIAVEVWLPASASSAVQAPTLCWFTRYWRRTLREQSLREYGEAIAEAGYVFVQVDARGSGASFGRRAMEYDDAEVEDMGEVIDWIARQPWSNGSVATGGVSYVGNTAELAATTQRPALKAAAPQFTDFDYYDQILFPGGLLNLTFARTWSAFVRALDRNDVDTLRSQFGMAGVKGVAPVDGDDGSLLAAAIADHAANDYYLDHVGEWVFRDDIVGRRADGAPAPRKPLYAYAKALERAATPMQHWAGWLDSATAAGALARFATIDAPNEILIGPWNHGALSRADVFTGPSKPVCPDAREMRSRILSFVDPYVRSAGAAPPRKSVTYYTMGADTWTRTHEWPPKGVRTVTLFMAGGGLLSPEPIDGEGACDRYTVDFEAGTGKSNRWATSMGGVPVNYGDRVEEDTRLLAYTGEPLRHAMTITGSPQVTLHVASTHEDGAFLVYLEAVSPDGRVVYLTEGVLRAIHRRVSSEPPPYEMFGPYRTFLRKDALPLVPGERAELTFNMLPTSVRIEAGWRLRVAVAGHDKDTFLRVPASGRPALRLFTGIDAPSCIRLPVDFAAADDSRDNPA